MASVGFAYFVQCSYVCEFHLLLTNVIFIPILFPSCSCSQTLALYHPGEGLWSGDRGTSPWKDSQVSWQSFRGMLLGTGESLIARWCHAFLNTDPVHLELHWVWENSHWCWNTISAQDAMGIQFPFVQHLDLQTQNWGNLCWSSIWVV